MGATLSRSWAASGGGELDIEDTDKVQFSEYPFSTGLADITNANESENREETEMTEIG